MLESVLSIQSILSSPLFLSVSLPPVVVVTVTASFVTMLSLLDVLLDSVVTALSVAVFWFTVLVTLDSTSMSTKSSSSDSSDAICSSFFSLPIVYTLTS